MSEDKYRFPIKVILVLYLLTGAGLTGCSLKRTALRSWSGYSPAQLTNLYQRQKEQWPSIAALRVWFKAKVKQSERKDYFRGALFYKQPDHIRLERWGFMNQLNGIVFSDGKQTVLEIPSRSLYYVGSPKDFAGRFWGEDILPSELPYLLAAQPPDRGDKVVSVSRDGKYLVLHYPDSRLRVGFAKDSGAVIYLAKQTVSGEKLWEIFYEKPVAFNGVKFMSKATMKIGAQTMIEWQIQKITINTKFKPGLFEPDIPANARIEPLKRVLPW